MSKERIATLVANLREADDFGQFASDMTPCRPVVAQLRELLDYLKPDEREAFGATDAAAPAQSGEPVAWMTYDGRIATDETKRTAMASSSKPSFNIPLYAVPQPARTDERTTQGAVALDALLNEICDEVLTDLPGLGVDMGTAFAKEVAVRFAQHLDEGPALHAQLDAAYAALDAVVEWTQCAGEAGEPLLELLLQHGVHPREFDPSLRVEALLSYLDAAGLKLRVWLEPLLPLAMRHHVMRYELRPANYPRVETHAEGESK